MTKAVNQNDLVDIINSATRDTVAVIDMVNKISAKISKIKALDKKYVDIFKATAENVIVSLNCIKPILEIEMDRKKIRGMKLYKDAIEEYMDILQLYKSYSEFMALDSINFTSLTKSSIDAIQYFIKVFAEIDKIKIKGMFILKIQIIKFRLRSVINLIKDLNRGGNDVATIAKGILNGGNIKLYMDVISNVTVLFDQISNIKLNWFFGSKLRRIKNRLKKLNKFILTLPMPSIMDLARMVVFKFAYKIMQDFIQNIVNIFNLVNETNIPELMWLKMWRFKRATKKVIGFIKFVNRKTRRLDLAGTLKSIISIKIGQLLVSTVADIILKLKNIKLKDLIKGSIKLRIIRSNGIINSLRKIFTRYIRLTSVLKLISIKDLIINKIKTSMLISTIGSIFNGIRTIKAGLFILLKLVIIRGAIKLIVKLVGTIARLKIPRKAQYNLRKLERIFNKLERLFASILLLTPIVMISTVAMVAWMVGLLMLMATLFVIKLLMKVISKTLTVKSFLALTLFFIFISILSIIIIQMAAMAILAVLGIIGAVATIAFLVAMIAVLVAMAAIGYLVMSIAPYLLPVIAGFAIILIMITLLVLVAVMLSILALIKLDKEKVLNSVKTVISTAKAVIDGIFGTDEKVDEDGKPKPWYQPVINLLGMGGQLIKAMLAVPFLAYTMVSIGLITIMAVQLSILQKLKLDKAQIMNNVRAVISAALGVSTALFTKPKEEKDNGEKKNWFVSVLEFAGGTILKLIGAILSIYFLAYSLVAMTLVLFLATELRLLQNINLDPNKISANVNAVINTAKMVTSLVFQKPEEHDGGESKGWFRSVFEFVGGGILKIVNAILSVYFLAFSLVAMTLLMFMAKELKHIQDLNLDPVGIQQSVDAIINTASMVSSAINRPTSDPFNKKTGFGKLISFFSPKLSAISDAIASVGFIAITSISIGMLANMAKDLNDIQKFKIESSITGKVNTIINTAQTVVDTVMGSQEDQGLIGKIKDKLKDGAALEHIKRYKSLVEEVAAISRVSWGSVDGTVVSNNKAVTDNYIKFVDRVDRMSLNKLETAARLFENMATFAKSINGNFDMLAESINEDLMPVLEELKEILNEIPEKIEANAASVSQSIGAYSSPLSGPSTVAGMEAQVSRENPGMSKEEVKKEVNNRLSEHARAQASSLEARFEELAELLKSGATRVSLV